MIAGTGIDIVEIDRFGEAIKKWGKSFLMKIFTDNEIDYSQKRKLSAQHFAARFATKEAVFKAFGGEPKLLRKWTDIEVLNDSNGKPTVLLHGNAEKLRNNKKISRVIVSMSHSSKHAVANAILLSENPSL